jgi:hypothetical protein
MRMYMRQQLRCKNHQPQATRLLLSGKRCAWRQRISSITPLQVAHICSTEADEEAWPQTKGHHLRCSRVKVHDGAVYVSNYVKERSPHGLQQAFGRRRHARLRTQRRVAHSGALPTTAHREANHGLSLMPTLIAEFMQMMALLCHRRTRYCAQQQQLLKK